jgi:hypothetical protein
MAPAMTLREKHPDHVYNHLSFFLVCQTKLMCSHPFCYEYLGRHFGNHGGNYTIIFQQGLLFGLRREVCKQIKHGTFYLESIFCSIGLMEYVLAFLIYQFKQAYWD